MVPGLVAFPTARNSDPSFAGAAWHLDSKISWKERATITTSDMFVSRLAWKSGLQFHSYSAAKKSPFLIRQRTRAFHASTPRNTTPLEAFLYLPHEMLQYLHVGLPWYTAIPVSAFVVRGLLVTTLGSRVRALTSRYVGLNPLRQAIAFQVRDTMMRKGGFTNPKQAKIAISKEIKKQTKALDRRWDCTLWGQIGWTFAQLPLFMMMAEVVRRMSGTKEGLLRMGMNAMGLGGQNEPRSSIMTSHYATDIDANPWFEATLANEGMLWFPDLLVADPTGVLPFLVSGLMFTNVYITKNTPGDQENRSTFNKVMRTTLLGVSLLIGPLCQEVPASLLLYWASSTSSVMMWNVWLDWRFPVVKGFAPCKRPLLMMPKTRRT